MRKKLVGDASSLDKAANKTADDAAMQLVRCVSTWLGDFSGIESGVQIDLLLSYRAVGEHQSMVDLEQAMPKPLARSTLVQQQYGLALNRLKQHEKAEHISRADDFSALKTPSRG